MQPTRQRRGYYKLENCEVELYHTLQILVERKTPNTKSIISKSYKIYFGCIQRKKLT